MAMAPLGVPSASAHTGLVLTLHDDGRGGISVDLAWDDGHPIPGDSNVAASLLATGSTTVGPAALKHLPGKPTVVYGGVLPVGTWTVYVDVAMPGIGQCEATVTVAAEARQPASTRCGKPTVAAAPPAESGPPAGLFWGLGAVGVIGAAGAGFLVFGRRQAP
ncbi:MAG TPA: hypothetical protein VM677_29390 [Actinokineospora sp.]|nr:hypothetical protein [Actinokineospora sp.]